MLHPQWQVSGESRARVEACLARGRHSIPGGNGASADAAGRRGAVGVEVITSNTFYTAQPVGVRRGVDFKSTGEVSLAIRSLRAPLFTPLFSPAAAAFTPLHAAEPLEWK